MSENMYCNNQKGSSKSFREGWDRIWGEKGEDNEEEPSKKAPVENKK